MTLNLSPNRMDRLPLHFSRWKGPMSIALQLTEEEFKATMKSVELINRENIRFTFYVVKASHSQQPRCTYINQKGKTIITRRVARKLYYSQWGCSYYSINADYFLAWII